MTGCGFYISMSTLLSAFFMTHMYLSQSSDNENRSPYHLTSDSDNLCRISPPGGYTDLQWRPLTSVIANHPVLVKHFRHIEGEGRGDHGCQSIN